MWFGNWSNDAADPLHVGDNVGGHKIRCIKYGCHYESFPAKSILHRDNWTCQICQRELLAKWTKIDGSETPHPRSPTIDHIVPLSYGPSGPGHRPDNVQAACWSCNIKKSDSFAGPLPTVQYS
jgi:5-methylcytosine-specific restriction endonuclease McrA